MFAGVPVGSYAPLPGAVFLPKLASANLSNTSRTVTIRGALSDAAVAPKVLLTTTLQPFELKRLDVPLAPRYHRRWPRLLSIRTDLPAMSFQRFDVDKAEQTALVPQPKFLHHANNGGGHPWSLEPGTSSTVALFNASAKQQIVNFNLGADGILWTKTVTIKPNETLSMDVEDIIRTANEKASANSRITALHGDISWFTPGQADVFGRVLIARIKMAGGSGKL